MIVYKEDLQQVSIFNEEYRYKLHYLGYQFNRVILHDKTVKDRYNHYILSHDHVYRILIIVGFEPFNDFGEILSFEMTEMNKKLGKRRYNTSRTYDQNIDYCINDKNIELSIDDYYDILNYYSIAEFDKMDERNKRLIIDMNKWTGCYEFVDFINDIFLKTRGE